MSTVLASSGPLQLARCQVRNELLRQGVQAILIQRGQPSVDVCG